MHISLNLRETENHVNKNSKVNFQQININTNIQNHAQENKNRYF